MTFCRASPLSISSPAKISRASGFVRASGTKASTVSEFIFSDCSAPRLAMIRASAGIWKRARVALRSSKERSGAVAPKGTKDVLPRWARNLL